MYRENLKCSHCGSQDLIVERSMIPQGISICCNQCGLVTPLVVIANEIGMSTTVEVNDEKSLKLYDESYYKQISHADIFHARETRDGE